MKKVIVIYILFLLVSCETQQNKKILDKRNAEEKLEAVDYELVILKKINFQL